MRSHDSAHFHKFISLCEMVSIGFRPSQTYKAALGIKIQFQIGAGRGPVSYWPVHAKLNNNNNNNNNNNSCLAYRRRNYRTTQLNKLGRTESMVTLEHSLQPTRINCMLVSSEGGKPEDPEKNPPKQSREPTQTQPTYGVGSWNRTWATSVGDECCHHCAIPALSANRHSTHSFRGSPI